MSNNSYPIDDNATANQHLLALLNTLQDAVIMTDAAGQITLVNPRLESVLGLNPEAVQGHTLASLADPQHHALVARLGFVADDLYLLAQELQRGVWSDRWSEIRFTRPETTNTLRRTLAPLGDGNDTALGLLMLFRAETDAANIRQAQDAIASMIVHDLRNPLTAVSSSLRILQDAATEDTTPLGEIVLQTTEISGRALRKVLHLVNALLDVGRLENGVIELEREPTAAAELVERIVSEFAPLADDMEITLSHHIMPNTPRLDIDLEQIERALYNLVDNAIKFTPAEGQIDLSVSQAAQPGFLQVNVRDTGPGIPADAKQRLFNRFEQLPGALARRRGTGIGLAFCKLSIEAHGGQIWIEDNPGGGSVFAFTLPTVKQS